MDHLVLTTGEIARHCGVDFRTVIRWADQGKLKAFRLPERGDRRVKLEDFLAFCRENDLPIPPEFANHSCRVLVVDDEVSMAQAMHRALKAGGFDVRVAGNGFEAGAMLALFAPALVILDLKMPGLGGIDIIRFVRRTERFARARILVVSGLPDTELARARAEGADDVLAKPFANDHLVEKTSRLIGAPSAAAARKGG